MSDKQFPARLTPFAKNLERTIGEGVDFDGCRTVIRQTPEGEAMLRTRGGMPEYSLIKKVRRVMPSCVRAPLTETAYSDRTYYAETTLLSTCAVFSIKVKYIKSISFLDYDGNKVVFYFSSPVGNAVAPENNEAIVFVEAPFSTRTHYDSVLMPIDVASGIDPIQYNGQDYRTPTLWDQVHFEQKPIKTMQFKVNGVLDITYLFEQESASGNLERPPDSHACMARDLIEISASRATSDEDGKTPVVAVRLQYQDESKYGDILLKSPGGFLQMVSTDFCNVTRMGRAWALSDLGIFGSCLHGVARSKTVFVDGVTTSRIEVVLYDGTIKSLPSGLRYQALSPYTLLGGNHVSRRPGHTPLLERAGLGKGEDVRERRQWFNYALFAQNLGALSGITWAGSGGTGTTAWMYYDQFGNGCYIYTQYASLFSRANIVIEPTPIAEFGHQYTHATVEVTAPYKRALDPGALRIAARTEDGRRTIFTTYEASDRMTYEQEKYSGPNSTDFWELLITGDVDLDATNCGLSFSFRLMAEGDREYYKRNTNTQGEQTLTRIGGESSGMVPGTPSDTFSVTEEVETTIWKLGCFFEGDELRWIDAVIYRHKREETTLSFVNGEESGFASYLVKMEIGDGSLTLRVNGVAVDSISGEYKDFSYSSSDSEIHYMSGLQSIVVNGETITETYVTDSDSAPIRLRCNIGSAIDGVWKTYVIATYSPHVFGLAEIRSTTLAYADATGVTFHGFNTPTGSKKEVIEGAMVDTGTETYYSYDPANNHIYATWNPATGELHTDTMPCCWI